MTPPATRHRPVAVPVLLLSVIALLALTGCSREFGPGERGPQVATSPEAARTKLRLQLADPCYTGDARAAWPRCARWVEETAGSARSAAGALPGDAALVRSADGVGAGRDDFLGRGCGPVPAPSSDPGACIAALLATRDSVRSLATTLAVPGA